MIESKSDIDLKRRDKTNLAVGGDRARLSSTAGNNKGLSADNISRLDKPCPDWTMDAINKVHYWVDSTTSGEQCYLQEQDCEKSGPKKKCVSCKILVHTLCIRKLNFECRPTFREAGVRNYRDENKKENILTHHWVHRKRQVGKCRQCNKSFQNKLRFNVKEIVALQCSWCKVSYHNKQVCFVSGLLTEACLRGQHYESIVPPTWIIKMPTKNTFKSSVRKSRSPDLPQRAIVGHGPLLLSCRPGALNPMSHETESSDYTASMTKSISLQSNMCLNSNPFVVKPLPNASPNKPLLVYINPKSGGNDGFRLLRKFQWLLNPRQVFDISDKGPRLGLELFGRVSNLRVLVCGGDGTAGWVMSEIDNLRISPSPPLAILPLGTGNDLARTTHWGGGYKDESLSKIISLVEEGAVKSLDRWDLTSELHFPPAATETVQKEPSITAGLQQHHQLHSGNNSAPSYGTPTSGLDAPSPSATTKLPLNVFNNYFSLGADASAALEFHESREANPEKFNSRIKNKMFYAGVGGRELIKGSWKDLSEYITLICDDIDYTPRLKELKSHVLLFLNIPRYSAGALPWGSPSSSYDPQSFSDGKLEIMGLTSTSLAALQVGGHADRICQCRTVHIVTTKTIPMQVDGEPCRLLPSNIRITLRNRFHIIMRPKRRSSVTALSDDESLDVNEVDQSMKVSVFIIPRVDYETNAMDRPRILEAARFYGMLKDKGGSTLSDIRQKILSIKSDLCSLDEDFTYLDSTTSERLFRIDRSREEAHFLMDICDEDLYVLDPRLDSVLEEVALHGGSQGNLAETSVPEETANDLEVKNNEEPTVEIAPMDTGIIESTERDIEDVPSTETKTVDEFNIDNKAPSPLLTLESAVGIADSGYLVLNGDHCNDVGSENTTAVESPETDISSAISVRKYKNGAELDRLFLESCGSHSIERVQAYVLDGADILVTDADGRSGLHLATVYKNLAVVHFLLHNGSDCLLEMRELIHGRTALHKAAELGRRSICSLLISAGASLLARDHDNLVPSQLTSDESLKLFLQSKLSSSTVLSKSSSSTSRSFL